ncbi:MAG: T9SS type A sorting domain-containing protein [Bacteroidales bacterium]|nr:T9SS type A sorting domain-containing protein [Bacteroidales bacterium]
MNFRKIQSGVMLLLVIGYTGVYAQEAVLSSGGNASGSGGSVSYSVGQVLYTTISAGSGTITQGVQQPFEISVVTGMEEAKGYELLISAFPNPVTDNLQLKVERNYSDDLTCQLYDITGKLIEIMKIESKETVISMSNLLPGIYLLKIIRGDKELKIFKIIKNR